MVLNSMQRMSAIATKTNSFVKLLEQNTKILDTRYAWFPRCREVGQIGWRRESPVCLVRHDYA
jgi:nicotinate-nucleotide pyrophosphorylase